MSKRAEISFHQGEDIVIPDQVVGRDISGWSLAFALASAYGSAALFTKTTGAGITITDGPAGKFEIAINDNDTDGLPVVTKKEGTVYVWDVKRTDADQEAVLTWGTITLLPKVAT
jgi:hypothetical protein